MKNHTWWLLGALVMAPACKKKSQALSPDEDARQRRDTDIVLEECDVESKQAEKLDADADGRPEVVRVKSGEREICRVSDLNFDGQVDRTVFFDRDGKMRRIESDFDRDGLIDEIALYEAGQLQEKQRATTLDGKLDTWDFYKDGLVVRTERDENGDGWIDQWWEYPNRGCPIIHVDTNSDGRPDPGASIDYCKETGYTPPPLPDEERKAAPEDFGTSDDRVEELSNVSEGQTPSEESGQSDSSGDASSSDSSQTTESK